MTPAPRVRSRRPLRRCGNSVNVFVMNSHAFTAIGARTGHASALALVPGVRLLLLRPART
jgi:hypothetical protein